MGILNTTPRTWVAAEVVTAAEMNAEIRDALTTIQSAWTAYVPTLTGVTTTSGSLTGKYHQLGKTILFKVQFTLGASSAITGPITVGLPVTATADTVQTVCKGSAFDSSVPTTYPLDGLITSTTLCAVRAWPTTAGNPYIATGTNVPMTWAVGDIVTIAGEYEAA